MPKKPFTPEEIAFQRERIMDSAATVMSQLGFHYLSMRKLAAELDMTASNIYNYFPSKESLLLHIRRRGFELLFEQTRLTSMDSSDSLDALYRLTAQLVAFAGERAGYYQLMFQPPVIKPGQSDDRDDNAVMNLDRLVEEWQQHVQSLLSDAVDAMQQKPDAERRRLTLYFLTAIHGLIDSYHHRSLPLLLEGVDLIPQDMVQTHTDWLIQAIETRVAATV